MDRQARSGASSRTEDGAARPPGDARAVVHVVAGVIVDRRGRVLLARRTEGRELAGLWEFPGGKVEPGEAPDAALARELQEELGIEARVGAPLIEVPHRMPSGRRLRLDVRRIDGWQGTPRGREGQALTWVPPERMVRYRMPPADRPVVGVLTQPATCLVTPDPGDDERAWCAGLARALEAGIGRIQFRAPGADDARRRRLLAWALPRCRAAGAELLVNGDPVLARDFGIGLHLRAVQLQTLRPAGGRLVADGVSLSASCHDAGELQRAEALGCDFAVLGPVTATATHPGQAGIGWEGFAALREQASLPIYAIGGLSPRDLAIARAHGAQGIAAIRGLWG